MFSNRKFLSRLPELDGVRGLAILLVVLFHYIFEANSNRQLASFFRLSWSGVDLFFVLSGFLIGGILLDAKNADGYYRTFYLRRMSRILPLYCILMIPFIFGRMYDRTIPVLSYVFFLQNWLMAVRGTFGSAWMSATWSLAVEEQFYLLLPFAVRRLSSKGILRFAIGMIVVAPTLRAILQHYAVADIAMFTLLPCRADTLGGGLLLAIACRNQTMWTWLTLHRRYLYAVFALCGFTVAVWTARDFPVGNLGYECLAVFYTSLLALVVVNPGVIVKRVFCSPVLMKLGTLAYSIYLFHNIILRLCHFICLGNTKPVNSNWQGVGVTVLSLIATLFLAEISWRVLERPLIERARRKYPYGAASPVACESVPARL